MIIKKNPEQLEIKHNMRGGAGDIELTHIAESGVLGEHCRLFSQIRVKPGDSIGEHQHLGEQEIFYFIQGNGIVIDNGKKAEIRTGDVMITPDNASHSVINTGDEDLVFIALILK
ncbi:cupin domain-containing protein [Acetobacterium woodii]|uniref:Cupin type-2 domain-containing protein n=1 Tax=Acetobacterium woodii (strain ATCC 29683 / DSM 1030 / JCM 2381 / KCTC 1655 / WB1) TaxID=931626 RepID=H6LC23_ACEWD|nr:cupin domain-containing protein [Acetobacterium woodii]AFA48971.1 hypothetical protein Awo_c21970 [Acetobacterium woodii DSM 1030]